MIGGEGGVRPANMGPFSWSCSTWNNSQLAHYQYVMHYCLGMAHNGNYVNWPRKALITRNLQRMTRHVVGPTPSFPVWFLGLPPSASPEELKPSCSILLNSGAEAHSHPINVKNVKKIDSPSSVAGVGAAAPVN